MTARLHHHNGSIFHSIKGSILEPQATADYASQPGF